VPHEPRRHGGSNQFSYQFPGIAKSNGQNMLDILNPILANQLNSRGVMAKLDKSESRGTQTNSHLKSVFPSNGDANRFGTRTTPL